MINIGGGRPGESDMALLGHPGKFTFCLAADEENSPFPPLHVAKGYSEDESVVTVIGAEAPHSVIYSGDADDPNNHKGLLDQLAVGLANSATNNAMLTGGAATVILNPEHADILASASLSREQIAQEIFNRCAYLPSEADVFKSFTAAGQDDKKRYAFREPADILILTAGGSGLYSMVMPSWCAGAHRNAAVCVTVEADQFCEHAHRSSDYTDHG
jgi:hypothetical protein